MVATHDLDQAARHFDRILLLNHRMIAFDRPQNVLQTDTSFASLWWAIEG